MQRLALFGGTGRTGKLFLENALKAGYTLNVLARDKSKVQADSHKLNVMQGDVLNQKAVEETVKGMEVVVSLFGHVKNSQKDLQTEGTKLIVEAMKKHDVKKIISLSGGGLLYEKDQPKLPDHLIKGMMKLFASTILNDAKNHAAILRQSGVDWIIVRAPRLNNDAEKGDYHVGWVGVNAGTKIARADLANFLLKQVEDDRFASEMPFVSY